jgi:eukaryotic-like serine/threonine-protein kinase
VSSSRSPTARLATGATRRLRGEPPPAPVVMERYRLHRRLGAGAFGTVWLARDERLERDVAVKILPRERIVSGRFEREARAAARLSHPGIVTLYEAAVDDEGAYLVSELVIGDTLDGLLAEGRLSDRDLVAIAINLCEALEHAHAAGVVHRDVKPSNVLVPDAPASATQLAKLTDFGVARVLDGDTLTLTGDVLGTLAYMAPEQAAGLEAGAPADLFSLALVIYEAITGVNPVAHGTATQRAQGHAFRPPHVPPLRRQRRDLPRELGYGIDLALRPRPGERGSLAELRESLQASQSRVSDDPGIVAGPLTSRLTRAPGALEPGSFADPLGPEHADRPEGSRWGPGRFGGSDPTRVRRALLGPAAGDVLEGRPTDAWPARAVGSVLAAALAAWLDALLLLPSPVPPAVAALIAGGATLLAPRLGWAALVTALCAGAAISHHPGGALVVAIAGLLPVALLPARPTAWPVAAAAPALGLIGLAGAWPALAGRAGTLWRRAVLGAVGWCWILVAAAISDRVLYLTHIAGSPLSGAWSSSVAEAVNPLLVTWIRAGALAPAAVWAVGAAVLPWVVRGRILGLDFVRVVVWAAVLATATSAATQAASGSGRAGTAPSLVLGAVASVVVAIGPVAWLAWRGALQSPGPGARVP